MSVARCALRQLDTACLAGLEAWASCSLVGGAGSGGQGSKEALTCQQGGQYPAPGPEQDPEAADLSGLSLTLPAPLSLFLRGSSAAWAGAGPGQPAGGFLYSCSQSCCTLMATRNMDFFREGITWAQTQKGQRS